MSKRGERLLERMRSNPADWRIEDVKALCDSFGLDLDRRPNGSHYGVSDLSRMLHVTVPSRDRSSGYIYGGWSALWMQFVREGKR